MATFLSLQSTEKVLIFYESLDDKYFQSIRHLVHNKETSDNEMEAFITRIISNSRSTKKLIFLYQDGTRKEIGGINEHLEVRL